MSFPAKYRIATGFAALLSISQAIAQAPAKQDWAALARADIDAAYTAMLDNHAGVFDPANPKFKNQLAAARDRGRTFASKASDAASYELSLLAFNGVLQDGHARIFIQDRAKFPSAPLRWPGFVAAWRGAGLFVYRALPDTVSQNARILECDGIAIDRLIERNVFTFVGRVAEKGQWWIHAPRLFIDSRNPYIELPKKCVFATNTKRETRTLSWTDAPADIFEAWRNDAIYGERLPIGMTIKGDGIVWIAMPSFQPDEAGRTAYKHLFTDVEAEHSQILSARAIVLDLRQNQGGSSSWSYEVAKRLWGAEQTDARVADYFRNVEIWWRVSAGNAAYLAEMSEEFRKRGEDFSEWKGIADEMLAVMTKGKHFVVRKEGAPGASVAAKPSDFNRSVYVIVPGQCTSACLDALDLFTRFPNVKLIGAPSSADTIYMETRAAPLPSGLASVAIPLKIWKHRPRASGQIYTPHIQVDTLEWSTAAFIERIEADLR